MSRRFQFSVRTLLVTTAVICLALGAGHLLVTYGNYVAASPTKAGSPIGIYGCLVRPFGPERLQYAIAWNRSGDDEPSHRNCFMPLNTDRKWLCVYDIRAEITGVYPGDYDIAVVVDPLLWNGNVDACGRMKVTW